MNPLTKIKAKLLGIEATPQMVSRGYALGVFLGTTPFIGTKVFIALVLTSFFKWNRLASVVGVYHINILTAPLFYGIAYGVGQWITDAKTALIMPGRLTFDWAYTTFFGSWEVMQALLVGGLVLGIPMSVIAYFLSYTLLRKSKCL
jgi:hypothetical protein